MLLLAYMNIDRHTPLRVIACAGPAVRGVLETLGLDYCCHGDATLEAECAHTLLDADDVHAALRGAVASPEEDWRHRGVTALIDHVVGVRHPESKRRLAEALSAAKALARADERGRPLLVAIEELAADANAQMIAEEGLVFARTRALSAARKGHAPFPAALRTLHDQEPQIRAAHARVHARLRSAIAMADGLAAREVRAALDAASHALLWQMHLENNELIPRARALEPDEEVPSSRRA